METGLKSAITLLLFYFCWTYLMPYMRKKKANLVKKTEANIEKRGLTKHYNLTYKIIKTSLYVILALMILAPILFFFIVIIFSSR